MTVKMPRPALSISSINRSYRRWLPISRCRTPERNMINEVTTATAEAVGF